MWCVICYDNDGGCDYPRFFKTREKAAEYIHESILMSTDDHLESKETYNDTVLCAKIWSNDFFARWECFDVTEGVASVLNDKMQS